MSKSNGIVKVWLYLYQCIRSKSINRQKNSKRFQSKDLAHTMWDLVSIVQQYQKCMKVMQFNCTAGVKN